MGISVSESETSRVIEYNHEYKSNNQELRATTAPNNVLTPHNKQHSQNY